MFLHVKEPQFEVKVSRPDPRFAGMLQEQFGGGNGELKAAMQYFTQAFAVRTKNVALYDLLMDIATEEFSHLEMVGMMITQLLDGLNEDLKSATEECTWLGKTGRNERESFIHEAATSNLFLDLSGGGPGMVNSAGQYWTGAYINANGDLTVDLRSNIGAESRAKIVYEYLKQYTDDPGIQDALTFLMTREVTHLQQFTAALNSLEENFPPGKLPGDARFQTLTFNMSDGQAPIRGPWNQGQGPWPQGTQWEYIENPAGGEWLNSDRRKNQGGKVAPIKGVTIFKHQEYVPASELEQHRQPVGASQGGGGGAVIGQIEDVTILPLPEEQEDERG